VLIFCIDIVLFFFAGKTRDAEEAVVTDQRTGSTRKGELPEGEKQFAYHAPEGKKKNPL